MMLEHMASLIETKPQSILEIGIGDGWFMRELQKKFPDASIIGVTRCEKEKTAAINQFAIKKENIYVCDMHEMPFEDMTFDLIIHRDVFEHSIAPFLFLQEMERVLKAGGRIIMGYPSFEWRNMGAHFSVLDPEDTAILAHKAGLGLQDIHYKVWMFYGMTFGYRSWIFRFKKEMIDDWYQESHEMFLKATNQG